MPATNLTGSVGWLWCVLDELVTAMPHVWEGRSTEVPEFTLLGYIQGSVWSPRPRGYLCHLLGLDVGSNIRSLGEERAGHGVVGPSPVAESKQTK